MPYWNGPGNLSDYALPREFLNAPAAARESLWRVEMVLIVLTVFLSPINYLRAGFAYITLSDVFAMLTLAVMYMQGRLPMHPFGRVSTLWYCGVFMLIFGLLFGSAINGNMTNGLTVAVQYFFSLLIMPMLLLQRPRAEVLLLVKVFVLAMVFVMLHGAWYVEFAPKDFRFVTRSGRLSSLVERENAAGALVAMAITFSLWLWFIREIRAALLVILLLPLVYGLLLTGSNTGFFLTALGAFFLVLASGRLKLMVGLAVTGAIFAFVIVTWGEYFLPEIFIKRVLGALETGDMNEAGTFSDRMYLIHEAYGISRDTILIGLGADQFRTISIFNAPVHNTYLLLLAEGGLVSLLGLFVLLITGLLIGLPVLFSPRTRWYGAMTVTVVVMLALVQNGIAHFYARFWAVPLFLAFSVSLMPDKIVETDEDVMAVAPPRAPRRRGMMGRRRSQIYP